VNRPVKTKLEEMSNFTRGTAALSLRHCCAAAPLGQNNGTGAPAENFVAQFKIYEWKLRSKKLLSFLQV
jgi:hypothetical protein